MKAYLSIALLNYIVGFTQPSALNTTLEPNFTIDDKVTKLDKEETDEFPNAVYKAVPYNPEMVTRNSFGIPAIQFTEFYDEVVDIVLGFNHNDLKHIVAVVDDEVQNLICDYCEIPRILENKLLRDSLQKNLKHLCRLSSNEIKKEFTSLIKFKDDMRSDKHGSKLLTLLNALYNNINPQTFMSLLFNLRIYKSTLKDYRIELEQTVRRAFRTVVVDFYYSLKPDEQANLKSKLEKYFLSKLQNGKQNKKSKHHKLHNYKTKRDKSKKGIEIRIDNLREKYLVDKKDFVTDEKESNNDDDMNTKSEMHGQGETNEKDYNKSEKPRQEETSNEGSEDKHSIEIPNDKAEIDKTNKQKKEHKIKNYDSDTDVESTTVKNISNLRQSTIKVSSWKFEKESKTQISTKFNMYYHQSEESVWADEITLEKIELYDEYASKTRACHFFCVTMPNRSQTDPTEDIMKINLYKEIQPDSSTIKLSLLNSLRKQAGGNVKKHDVVLNNNKSPKKRKANRQTKKQDKVTTNHYKDTSEGSASLEHKEAVIIKKVHDQHTSFDKEPSRNPKKKKKNKKQHKTNIKTTNSYNSHEIKSNHKKNKSRPKNNANNTLFDVNNEEKVSDEKIKYEKRIHDLEVAIAEIRSKINATVRYKHRHSI